MGLKQYPDMDGDGIKDLTISSILTVPPTYTGSVIDELPAQQEPKNFNKRSFYN